MTREEYRASCTHYRKGGKVHEIHKAGSVVFSGTTVHHKGCNAAKRYVQTHSLRSYTIKD